MGELPRGGLRGFYLGAKERHTGRSLQPNRKFFVGNGLCAVPFCRTITRRGRAQGSRPAYPVLREAKRLPYGLILAVSSFQAPTVRFGQFPCLSPWESCRRRGLRGFSCGKRNYLQYAFIASHIFIQSPPLLGSIYYDAT